MRYNATEISELWRAVFSKAGVIGMVTNKHEPSGQICWERRGWLSSAPQKRTAVFSHEAWGPTLSSRKKTDQKQGTSQFSPPRCDPSSGSGSGWLSCRVGGRRMSRTEVCWAYCACLDLPSHILKFHPLLAGDSHRKKPAYLKAYDTWAISLPLLRCVSAVAKVLGSLVHFPLTVTKSSSVKYFAGLFAVYCIIYSEFSISGMQLLSHILETF